MLFVAVRGVCHRGAFHFLDFSDSIFFVVLKVWRSVQRGGEERGGGKRRFPILPPIHWTGLTLIHILARFNTSLTK